MVAYVNSVVCHPMIAPLMLAGVPQVSLIHEFANYVYPAGTVGRMSLLSSTTVFPARIVRDASDEELSRFGAFFRRDSIHIRPQGYNGSKSTSRTITAEKLAGLIGLDTENPNVRILFGAGQVQPRKGVDLFLQAAQKLAESSEFDWRFIWVGAGYDPQRDMVTSVYIQHQIRESGLTDKFFMFDEQSSLEPFWEVADVFFLSSRMDPFPNVALDAMERSLPVVCFSGGTGISELQARFPFAVQAVNFADAAAAASAVDAFASELDAIHAAFSGDDGAALSRELSFDSYVADLKRFSDVAKESQENVKTVELQLDMVSSSEVDSIMQSMPAIFRGGPIMSSDMNRANLAVLMANSFLTRDLSVEIESRTIQESGTINHHIGAGYGNPTGSWPSSSHIVHLHVEDAVGAQSLFSSASWTSRLLNSVQTVVTASDMKVLDALSNFLPDRIRLVDGLFQSGLHALRHVLSNDSSSNKEFVSNEYITFCSVSHHGTPGVVSRDVLDCLATLMSGAALECLTDRGDVIAVAPVSLCHDDTRRVREAFLKVYAGDGFPTVHAPRFTGTYRSTAVLDFFERQTDFLTGISAGLDRSEKMAFAALVFAHLNGSEDGMKIVRSLRLHN